MENPTSSEVPPPMPQAAPVGERRVSRRTLATEGAIAGVFGLVFSATLFWFGVVGFPLALLARFGYARFFAFISSVTGMDLSACILYPLRCGTPGGLIVWVVLTLLVFGLLGIASVRLLLMARGWAREHPRLLSVAAGAIVALFIPLAGSAAFAGLQAIDPPLRCALLRDGDLLHRTDCYTTHAEETDDPQWCGRISDDRSRDSCYLRFIRDADSSEQCARIGDEDVQDRCRLAVAERKKEPAICEDIGNTDIREECLVRGSVLERREQCDALTEKPLLRQICYGNITPYKRDPETCPTLTDALERNGCWRGAAADLDDVTLCDNIPIDFVNPFQDNKSMRAYCVLSAAAKHGGDICDRLPIPAERDGCRTEVVQYLKDVSVCAGVVDPFQRDICHFVYAHSISDVSACAPIQDAGLAERCQNEVQ